MAAFTFQRVVWDSDLPPHLKLVALAMLSFADSDGCNIYPSIARVAAMVGKSSRVVQRDVAALVVRGFLVHESAGGGRAKATRYRFNENPDAHVTVSSTPNHDAHVTVSRENPDAYDAKPRRPRPKTLTPTTENHDAHVTRSIHDLSNDQTMTITPAAPAPDDAADRPTHTRPGIAPPSEVYAAIAKRVVGKHRSDDLSGAKESMKRALATECIPYDSTVVSDVIERAFIARDNAAARFRANLGGARQAVAS
jgi:hypothetical protein